MTTGQSITQLPYAQGLGDRSSPTAALVGPRLQDANSQALPATDKEGQRPLPVSGPPKTLKFLMSARQYRNLRRCTSARTG